MKEEKKRYFLVEYYGNQRNAVVETKEEKDKLLNEVRKFNERKKSSFLLGNITVNQVGDKYYLTGHLYKKYTGRMTISEIDEFTSKYTEEELAMIFKDESMMINGCAPDINIAYLETTTPEDKKQTKYERGVRYIPVLYKDDLKYMDKSYIRKCLYFHAEIKDYEFFRDLANEFDVYHFVGDEIGELRQVIDKCINQGMDLTQLYIAANHLYEKFICEYERDESLTRLKDGQYQISRRRLRDFGFFVKFYNIRESKLNSPLRYNKPLPKSEFEIEESGQLKLRLK